MKLLILAMLAAALLAPVPVASAQACVLTDLNDEAVVRHVECQVAQAQCYARAVLDQQTACTL